MTTLVLPTEAQMKEMHVEYGVQLDRQKEDIEALKTWMEKQPHLPRVNDEKLVFGFLHGSKNSMEKSKKCIDMYYTVRGCAPEFFSNRDPTSPHMKEILDVMYILPMPQLMEEGYRVTVHGMFNPEMDKFDAVEAMKLVFQVGDIRMREDICRGDVMVYDMSGSSITHLGQLTLPLVRKFMICGQGAYPVRLTSLHLVNVPAYLDKILALFKPLMKDKLAERIHVHPDLESLHKLVPKSVLPAQFGGDAGDVKVLNAAWRAKLESYKDWFIEQDNIKVDESKRPGKPITQDDLFGLDGSFRQLSVD